MPLPWTLRDSAPPDFDTLYQVDQQCYPPGIAYSRRTLRTFLRMPGAVCRVAERDASIGGFILGVFESSAAHIITLDVLKELRRQGLGTVLLEDLESIFAARGVARVELETAVNNAPAVAFWKSRGYRTVGVLERYYLDRIDAYWMVKTLSPVKER